jgi:hypothetical protein
MTLASKGSRTTNGFGLKSLIATDEKQINSGVEHQMPSFPLPGRIATMKIAREVPIRPSQYPIYEVFKELEYRKELTDAPFLKSTKIEMRHIGICIDMNPNINNV